ncbi:hypothetical protein [Massilia scottii]|uniref:hypothetical protein n=1 Tax=Massilia scottii TaxID=3057166 RepID=UPI00279685A6|nr:hypothetical protein [Massilia sp. CCM 9029]MDQ1831649.1 hypothetical protein [Massilia sp. CCM 9029]
MNPMRSDPLIPPVRNAMSAAKVDTGSRSSPNIPGRTGKSGDVAGMASRNAANRIGRQRALLLAATASLRVRCTIIPANASISAAMMARAATNGREQTLSAPSPASVSHPQRQW